LERKENNMSEEIKNALDISIAEADRGEVTHYDSLEDLIREIG